MLVRLYTVIQLECVKISDSSHIYNDIGIKFCELTK